MSYCVQSFFLFQDVLGSRTLGDRVLVLLGNMDTYFKFASREPTSAWESQLSHFEAFFRKLPSVLPENVSLRYMQRFIMYWKMLANSFCMLNNICRRKGKAEALAFVQRSCNLLRTFLRNQKFIGLNSRDVVFLYSSFRMSISYSYHK